MDLEQRVRRLEYLLVRVATTNIELFPPDAREKIAEIVREFSARDDDPEGD